jgi:hypothetical protein
MPFSPYFHLTMLLSVAAFMFFSEYLYQVLAIDIFYFMRIKNEGFIEYQASRL